MKRVPDRRLLENNPEYSFVIEAPQIRMKRLGFAGHGLMACKIQFESSEATIAVHVINHNCASRPQGCPSEIELEPNVLFSMKAIMDEDIDLAQAREDGWKVLLA